MNEILAFKQIKKLMRQGVPKTVAKMVVKDVASMLVTQNEDNLEYAVEYALSIADIVGLRAE